MKTLPDTADQTPASGDDTSPTGRLATPVARWWAVSRRTLGRTLTATLPALALLAALVLLWQWYASQPDRCADPADAARRLGRAGGPARYYLATHAGNTARDTDWLRTGAGGGGAFGALIDFSPWLRRAIYPLLVASQTIPIITLAPLLVLWFGFGLVSKSIVVLLVCFFPIVVALADGLRSADPELIRLFRAFGAGPVRIFWSVRLPGALPSLFSGVRIAIAYSVIGAIFGEYVGASAGLGFYMQLKQHSFATAGVLAAIVFTALLSIALFASVALIERLALPWYYLQRRREGSVACGNEA